ncbi:omega-hydroxy-beta-dihydromenaquinone-9 sulfotransferase [Methylomarinovum tepidoasis]|uniref:Omega-hydroxy-beta-dihydromenaquinone-9 sulfotransferase n=1 Tax=Methylomarinovum tepidoasis TaxID=2840183 RepID=A0AAU9CEY3_9GAMM|nr:sulfotransferase [Methylomarinovum sp. IN45]BCX87771.1 omega-hydroxy-beta-dihydromenaquinone-9 sulfotransferase [Methylomarinovum sp. IN45]
MTKTQCKSDRPIFVVGTPRSGTTLTARILGRHSKLFMPGETHFFEDIYSRAEELGLLDSPQAVKKISQRLFNLYERYNEPFDQKRIEGIFPTPDALEKALVGCQSYGDLFARFMEIQCDREGKSRWGNNVPRDLFWVEEILRFFPDAKFIVCVRDIRAFLLSYKGKWRITRRENVDRLKALYHPVITSFLWKSSMRRLPAIQKAVPQKNLLIMRYEDLVRDPEASVRRLCRTVEEEFEPAMLEVDSHNSSNALAAKGIFSSSIDRWRTDLAPEEIAIAQAIAGPELEQLGYRLESIKVSQLKVAVCIASTPFALWRALRANRAVRGPIVPYLVRRLGSLVASS